MNKINLSVLLILVLYFFSGQLQAQDGYTYTLVDNGGYSYTIAAVPNVSSSNFATSIQSYGFTITLPDGFTAAITSSLGGAASATPFDGNAVGDPTIDGYLITETLRSPASLTAPSVGTTSAMVTIQMSAPTALGTISILANDSVLATTVTPLKSFMQADMIDNGMAEFVNVVDSVGSGLSGISSIMFSTLSILTEELIGVSVYPNPAKETITIKGLSQNITKVELYNIAGQKILTKTNGLETINIDTLQSGVYFTKIYTDKTSTTLKVIKE